GALGGVDLGENRALVPKDSEQQPRIVAVRVERTAESVRLFRFIQTHPVLAVSGSRHTLSNQGFQAASQYVEPSSLYFLVRQCGCRRACAHVLSFSSDHPVWILGPTPYTDVPCQDPPTFGDP